MTDTQQSIPIAAELRSISAIAAALSALAESREKDDVFYVALELSTRLDAVCDRQLEAAKLVSDKGV